MHQHPENVPSQAPATFVGNPFKDYDGCARVCKVNHACVRADFKYFPTDLSYGDSAGSVHAGHTNRPLFAARKPALLPPRRRSLTCNLSGHAMPRVGLPRPPAAHRAQRRGHDCASRFAGY